MATLRRLRASVVRPSGVLAVSFVLALAALLPLAFANSTGLSNPGFEMGLADWEIVSAADSVVVPPGSEGPDDFKVYADENITVEPYADSRMLRLGTPDRQTRQQKKGVNAVRQTFRPASSTLRLAFRLFSWEFRGYDTLTIDLRDANGNTVGDVVPPIVFENSDGTTVTTSAMPLVIAPTSSGSSFPLLDSGWTAVTITGVPTGSDLTLEYALDTAHNGSHPTWVYLDAKTPVATFEHAPASPYEGDVVDVLGDRYADADGNDDVASWHWEINGPLVAGPPSDPGPAPFYDESDGPNSYFIPPDDGEYIVTLTVTDDTGQTARKSKTVVVQNAPPEGSALDAEMLVGGSAPLTARFIDPGWTDLHTVQAGPGGPPSPELAEDRIPGMTSGIVTDTVQPPLSTGENVEGTLVIADEDGGSTDVSYTVSAVEADSGRFEPNDDLEDLDAVPDLPGGGSYLSWVQSAGDIDFYEILADDGGPLPWAAQALVTLRDLPADLDAIVLSVTPGSLNPEEQAQTAPWRYSSFQASPWRYSPWRYSPWRYSPWRYSPWRYSPWRYSPWRYSPWRYSPWRYSPWRYSPWRYSSYPLSEMAFTGLTGDNVGGTDIPLSELGVDPERDDIAVVGFSANPGTRNEVVLASSELVGQRLFVAVKGANDAWSAAPYRLDIEVSEPDSPESLADELPPSMPVVDESAATTQTETLATDDAPVTLFVTQKQRMEAYFDVTASDEMFASLAAFAQRSDIRGEIISVPSVIYDDWDTAPSSVDAANDVARQIRTLIRERLSAEPTIEYVVLVGSDRIVPHRRVVDETIVSNERYYAESSFLRPDSPLFASLFAGFNLTDDYYADELPISWQGRSLYVPDCSIARLVEEPDEIMHQLDVYEANDGLFDPSTAMVSGYDFFDDGATAMSNTLTSAGMITDDSLIGDWWNSDDLRSVLLGGTGHDISNVNAHFVHFAGMAAQAFINQDTTDILRSQEVASAVTPEPVLAGGLGVSMGCHAGLCVPDVDSEILDPLADILPELDFPQAMAQQGAVWVASTGHGLGDDVGIAGTEELMNVFAEDVFAGGGTVGRALTTAKQRYLSDQAAATVYNEKSSIQFTMYGLPQYRVAGGGVVAPSAAAGSGSYASASFSMDTATVTPSGSFDLSLTDVDETSTRTYAIDRVDTDSGSYFTADGESQHTAFRPIQPRVTEDLPEKPEGPVHGLLLTAGTYEDHPDFDPANARPTIEWELNDEEFQIALDGFWPSVPAGVNNLETLEALRQTLVVTPGQFQGKTTEPIVTGLERLYRNLDFETLRSTSDDWGPPVIYAVELTQVSPDTLRVVVEGSDETGVYQLVAMTAAAGEIASARVTRSSPAGTAEFAVNMPIPEGVDARDIQVVVQMADEAGNVAVSSSKGATWMLDPQIEVSAGPNVIVNKQGPTTLTGFVPWFDELEAPVTYEWAFGDGESIVGTLPGPTGVIDPDGNLAFTVDHVYSSFDAPHTTTLRVTDAAGQSGSDTGLVLPKSAEVWVAVDGDDEWGIGTEEQPFRTIGRGVEAADEDVCAVVHIGPGTYNESVTIADRAIELAGAGQNETIIDPQQTAPGIVGSGLAAGTEIRDLQVTNGDSADAGAGMRFTSSHVSIARCTITECTAPRGAGVMLEGSSAAVTSSVFSANHAEDAGGGLLALDCEAVLLSGNIFRANTSSGSGGGAMYDSTPGRVENNLFVGNTSGFMGSPLLDCEQARGGGLALVGAAPAVINTTFAQNAGLADGWGFFPRRGGGLSYESESWWFGGWCAAKPIVFNCIFADNDGGDVEGVSVDYSYVSDGVNMRTACLDGTLPPGFVDPLAGDFRLAADSVCKDAGAGSWSGQTAPTQDLLGTVRPQFGAWDMGAYEYYADQP